jgi:hypothetical protein
MALVQWLTGFGALACVPACGGASLQNDTILHPGSACPLLASGTGLLAGTVRLSATGQIVGLDPSPHRFFTPEPGDADLPVTPRTVIIVGSTTAPTSSDSRVLAAVPSAPEGGGFMFRAASPGCAVLTGPGLHLTIAVRSPTS